MNITKLLAVSAALFAMLTAAVASYPELPDNSTPIILSFSECNNLRPNVSDFISISAYQVQPRPLVKHIGQASAPEVPDFNVAYNWSFSGRQYVTATKAIRKNVLLDGMDFVAAAGYELTTGVQPSFGFGFSYGLDFDGFYVRALATTLFPQSGAPDVAVGVMFGVRF